MAGTLITDAGRKIIINRSFKASPDYTAPSLFKIGTGTTAPTVSDTDVETGVNINGGATKAFVSGYPILDETNFQVTVRCLLNSTEGNGNTLTEFGLFNTDGSPLMYSRSTHTAISKVNTVEVTYIEKDKIT